MVIWNDGKSSLTPAAKVIKTRINTPDLPDPSEDDLDKLWGYIKPSDHFQA
jgi:hypothetical protein